MIEQWGTISSLNAGESFGEWLHERTHFIRAIRVNPWLNPFVVRSAKILAAGKEEVRSFVPDHAGYVGGQGS